MTQNLIGLLASPTRFAIVVHLMSASSGCVETMAERIDIPRTTVSHQLTVLLNENVVTFRRDGRFKFYEIAKTPEGKEAVRILKNAA